MTHQRTRSWIRTSVNEREERRLNRDICRVQGPFHDTHGMRKHSAFGVLEDVLWDSLERACIGLVLPNDGLWADEQ